VLLLPKLKHIIWRSSAGDVLYSMFYLVCTFVGKPILVDKRVITRSADLS
jgi:hypothetical protein